MDEITFIDVLTAAGSVVTAAVALVALVLAKRQLDSGREIRDENDAQDSFRDYLRVALEYPTLAAGQPAEGEDGKYRWFVTYMLAALEKIQFAMEDDPEWQKTLLETLSYHVAYLRDPAKLTKLEFDTYDPRMQALLRDRFGVHH